MQFVNKPCRFISQYLSLIQIKRTIWVQFVNKLFHLILLYINLIQMKHTFLMQFVNKLCRFISLYLYLKKMKRTILVRGWMSHQEESWKCGINWLEIKDCWTWFHAAIVWVNLLNGCPRVLNPFHNYCQAKGLCNKLKQ